MAYKAFLSHSSLDKPLVEAVARELGRQYCLFDKYNFDTGTEFRQAIQKGLDDSSIFVLFLSKASLKSAWVDFEQDEAFDRKIHRLLSRVLIFRISAEVSLDDVPSWLRKGLIADLAAPKPIARQIRQHLDELLIQHSGSIAVGRTQDLERLQDQLLPITGAPPPRLLLLYGLGGIGRRTLAKRVARDQLGLRRLLEIEFDEGDSLRDLTIKLASELEVYNSESELRQMLETIRAMPDSKLFRRVANLLRTALANKELPTFVCTGASSSDDGTPKRALAELFSVLQSDNELYAAAISGRRLTLSTTQIDLAAQQQVASLSDKDTKQLLVQLASRDHVELGPGDISELSEYVAGYPPAAIHAVRLCSEYGTAVLLADKNRLVSFRAESFVRHLSRVTLDKPKTQVLGYLATYSPLPLGVLGALSGQPAQELAANITYLIDCALVELDPNGYYSIANPLVDSVSRFTGHLELDHERVAQAVIAHMESSGEPRLSLYRISFRAMGRAGKASSDQGLHLANDLVRLAKETYDARDYAAAAEWAKLALHESPNSTALLETLTKALIHLEHFDAAEAEINKIAATGDLSRSLFLSGVLARSRSKFDHAITLFEAAKQNGRKGVAVHRELAQCYSALGQLGKAETALRAALIGDRDNRFLLDLLVKVLIQKQDQAGARAVLADLKNVDQIGFYSHRLSTLESGFNNWKAAKAAALEAVQATPRPAFEMLSQLAKSQIELREFTEASSTLKDIEKLFPKVKQDIRLGLWCKLLLHTGKPEDALQVWSQIRDKNLPVHLALRLEALKQIVQRPQVPAVLRDKYIVEILRLEEQLGDTKSVEIL